MSFTATGKRIGYFEFLELTTRYSVIQQKRVPREDSEAVVMRVLREHDAAPGSFICTKPGPHWCEIVSPEGQ